jgi:hypothetical protein
MEVGMSALIWIGAVVTVLGLAGLIYCVVTAIRARKAGLEGEEMANRLRGLVTVNLAALALSTIGLMTVILGIYLG